MKRKAIFFDRDGTLILEPPDTFQIDSLDKLEFMPGVFRSLHLIRKTTSFDFVMVSNQDGLGLPTYPLHSFETVQAKMLTAFKNEGIEFDDILIDPSLPAENKPTRKPGTAMLNKYLAGDYDLENSWVIGDRASDIQLAYNLGAKGIWFMNPANESAILDGPFRDTCKLISDQWEFIAEFIRKKSRNVQTNRNTLESKISIGLALDGSGSCNISTGIGFLDHMLEQLGKHGQFDLELIAKGDLHVDEHHTIEDAGLALGEAFKAALGSKAGIGRYGFALPMDESAAMVLIDLSGRPSLEWNVTFTREKVGELPTEMVKHFFKSFSDASLSTLHVKCYGDNEHHKIEAIFKAFAKALRQAVNLKPWDASLPTTKGLL